MKKVWEQLKDWKYSKFVFAVLFIFLIGWGIYILFVQGMLQFQKNEKAFVEGVKKYYEYNPTKLPDEGGYKELQLSEMFQGSWVKSLYVPKKNQLCDGDSFVRVVNQNGEYRYITYLKCGKYESKIDHSAPEIVLNGDETIVIHLGETYQDPGVREVKDNHDNIEVSSVKVDTSKVDTSKMGTYQVTYRAYDANYNVARKTRTVVVAETLSAHIQKEKGAGFVYTGAADDNYVMFSGMLWRIVQLDQEGNLGLITDNNIANVAYGMNDVAYSDSNVYKWLNQYFLSQIQENSQKYLLDTKWCYDDMSNVKDTISCNSSVTAKVGLLSLENYEKSKVNNRSYLVNQARFYMLNRPNGQNVWVSDIYNEQALLTSNTEDVIGVRPVVYLTKDIFVTSGAGTYEDPYKLQDYLYAKENDLLNTRLVGEYVVYSGYTFRVAGKDEDGNTKLVGVGLLQNSSDNELVVLGYDEKSKIAPNTSENGNLYYLLNQDALNYISETSLVTHEFEVPVYAFREDWDQLKKVKVTSKIGLPASYEMFAGLNRSSSDYQIYWLSDYSEDDIISILNGNNGVAFHLNRETFPQNGIKPVIYLKSNLKIASGKGTVANPYYLR